jgi:hypothetical protein
MLTCWVCGTHSFTLGEGWFRLDLSDLHSRDIKIGGGPSLPSIALVCQQCGNTLLLNMVVLGLQDLLEPIERLSAAITAAAKANVTFGSPPNVVTLPEDTPTGEQK